MLKSSLFSVLFSIFPVLAAPSLAGAQALPSAQVQTALSAPPAPALPSAEDITYHYCDDITRIDHLQDRSAEPLQNFLTTPTNVDRIVVSKDRKELYLISGNAVIRKITVAFGLSPQGPKQFDGDNKTPEGVYFIDGKNPKSDYYLSLHVSYPNFEDMIAALAVDKKPGGEIMLHGFPNNIIKSIWVSQIHPANWTRGCIAMRDQEINEVFQLVQVNTPIEICAMTSH